MSSEREMLVWRSPEAKRISPLFAPKKEGDVGYDLPTCRDTIVLAHNEAAIDVPTGIKVKIPEGFWGLVTGRSGALRKSGLSIKAGVIDNGFTGELLACCYNRTDTDILVSAGTKLVQLVLLPLCVFKTREVDVLPATDRGESGFGSTGK